MRPTDENQAASTRPNLMSSRRGAGEENILAMLERDSARRPATRMSGMRLASYGAAAALAGILAGGIAWLAYDNHGTAQALPVQYELANVAAAPVLADAAPPATPPAPVAASAPAMDAPRAAVIVDESARGREATAAGTPPPLVMLPAHELKGAKAPPPTPMTMPPRIVQEPARQKPAKSEVQTAAPRPALEKKADKAPKLASRVTKPAPVRGTSTAKARSDEAARPRKLAATVEAPVDRDVALISAIIQHSERHRAERDAAGCNNPKCPPKPTSP